MRGYNLYYKNRKLNLILLSKKNVDNMLSHSHVTCVNKITKERIIVPTNEITCIECIMV